MKSNLYLASIRLKSFKAVQDSGIKKFFIPNLFIEITVLSKAFSGELGTNDPNDEPAIELLKRSLKEKSKVA